MTRRLLFSSLVFALLVLAGCNLGTGETPDSATEVINLRQQCENTVQDARDIADSACPNGMLNQACHASELVEITTTGTDVDFSEVGAIVDISNMTSLRTSPLDETTGTWGIAEIYAQANIPGTIPGQNVQFIAFGATELLNTDETMSVFTVSNTLPRNCEEIAASGILLQTPTGLNDPVTMQINGAEITFGSTLYINAVRDNQLVVALLEGDARVRAEGESKRLIPGTQVRMLLGEEDGLTVITPPTDPEPYNLDAINNTPVELLDREVELIDPVNADDIATSTPTHTPTSTDTPTPTNTSTPDVCTVTADTTAVNLRGGPGTVYDVVGVITRDDSLVAVGRNASQTWYVVNDEGELVWIAGSVTELSGDCTNLQIVAAPPTPTPIPTDTPTPTPTPTRTPSPVYATEEVASCVDPDLSPQYGSHTPDDLEGSYSTSVVSGGAVSLDCVPRITCRGYTGEAPDFTFELDFNNRYAYVDSLSLGVTSEEDTVLLIQLPNGRYVCDDDSGEGLNPAIRYDAEDRLPEGTYHIWVASYISDVQVRSSLFIDYNVYYIPQ